MDPFAAGALTLEHDVAGAVEVGVEGAPAEAVDSLVFAITVRIVGHPRLLLDFIFLPNEVLHFLWTIHISVTKHELVMRIYACYLLI